MALLSIVNSLNVTESLIEFIKHFVTFLILVFTFSIFNNNRTYINSAIVVVVGFLFFETCYILKFFIDNYSFENPPSRLREFQGLAYNQNIASNSILVKIPLAIFLLVKTKTKIYKYLLLAIIAISVFDILIIGSRSAIYGIYLLTLFLIGIFLFARKFNFLNINKKNLLKSVFIILSVFVLQNFLYTNSMNLKALDRSAQLDDYSTNYRLNLWESSFEMIKEFPLLGIGIGNWKIISIKYSKNYMSEYQVPKHAHNDFIQIMAETGILGGLFYLFFLISPFYFIVKNYSLFSTREKELSVFLTFSLIFIGIDAFFNFPRARPYSLLNLFWVIAFMYNLKANKINE
tara:strand:+ start:88 stop:1125 length:1038 start_codon:yes stop_codon:yes gene_type:complete